MNRIVKSTRELIVEIRKRASGNELYTIDTILNLPGAVDLFDDAMFIAGITGRLTREQVRLGIAWIAAGRPKGFIDDMIIERPLAIIGPGGEYTYEIRSTKEGTT